MTRIFSISDLTFGIESDGWRSHDIDRDTAVDNLETTLRDMPDDELAALHAALKGDEYPEKAERLCFEAVRPVVADWHDPSAPALMLYVP